MASIDIAIIGGGIAGLTLAIGLLQRGVKVTIYERSHNFREIGAGIGFTPNAEWAMKVLDPRIHAAFKSVTVQNGDDWFRWMDGEYYNNDNASGKAERLIHEMYLGERGFEGCARADFLEALLKLVPDGTIQFNKNVQQIVDREPDDQVEILFTDETSAKADAVVGCDGIRSKVRRLLFGEDEPMSHPGYTHKFGFRGLIPVDKAKAVLASEKINTRHMYLGPNGHAVTFPVAGGKLLNVAAFTTDRDEWVDAMKFTAPARKSEAVEAFKTFNPTVRTIISLLPDQLDKWAVFDTWDNPLPTFAKGRICLAGDAAHASAPYHGAGAGFAIEDAAVLADLMQRANADERHSKSELLRIVFTIYTDSRLERAQWLVRTSRFVGEMYEWQDPVVGNNPELCAKEIDWRSKKIWHYDIDGMIADAQRTYREKVGA